MRAKTLTYDTARLRILYEHAGDKDLIAAHAAGDEEAFAEIMRRYTSPLRRFLREAISDHERAEDILQDVFLRVHRHAARFNPSYKFSSWIYHIASNFAKNELRNRTRGIRGRTIASADLVQASKTSEEMPLEFADSRLRPDRLYEQRELEFEVEEAISKLNPEFQQVFRLREREGKSYAEIVRITSCPLGTVKSRLNRARLAFKEHIEHCVD